MTEKHTPGPWIAREKTNPDCNEGTHYITCADGALGYWRGHKQGHADSNWVLNKADAQLIAAAPELLEALSEYLAAMDSATFHFDKPGAFKAVAATEKARKAIAKAAGDAP